MATKQVNVCVADDHLGRFSEVVTGMEKAGLKVEQQLEAVGVVTGSIDAENIPALNQVPGIGAVELTQAYQLPPPDDDLQ